MPMPVGVRIRHAAGVTRLKWHRAKRLIEDTPFTARRIEEGFCLGASFEVDIRPYRDGGFVLLHDDTLDRETTGCGPVHLAAHAALRAVRMRDPDGALTQNAPLFLDDLGRLATSPDADPQAMCQLDLKAGLADLDARAVTAFARALDPAPGRFVVSGGDADAVRLLGRAAGITVGYDPCDRARGRDLTRAALADAFVAEAAAAVPEARIVYLDWRLVVAGLAAGTDLVARFHENGCEIDAYTLDPAIPGAAAILGLLLAAGVDQITTDQPGVLAAMAAGAV